MVFRIEVGRALEDLSLVHRRLLDLIEWNKLAEQEHWGNRPPAFDPHTRVQEHLREDIKMFYDLFVSTSAQLRHLIGRHDLVCTADERSYWRQRLQELDRSVERLHITQRFIRI